MGELAASVRQKANDIDFSGVISARIGGEEAFAGAFGCRDRANAVRNRLETRFAIASGTKGFTAVGVAKLIEEGRIAFDSPARSILGEGVSNLHPGVTIRHLLDHTSGIGDYLDEEKTTNIDEITLEIPVRDLESPGACVPLLEAAETRFSPGARFSYSNSGFVVLALIIEAIVAESCYDFIQRHVFAPAGMTRSGFFRSDELPEDTATGYVFADGAWRTNVFHLPVRGGGDGGAFSTIGDMDRFWKALKSGRLLNEAVVAELLRPRNVIETEGRSYGCGFWLDEKAALAMLEGYDAGVSFHSAVSRNGDDGYTVISNTSSGAWPIVRLLSDAFGQSCAGHALAR